MIIEDIDKNRLSYHDRYLKDYSREDLRQLAFDFTSTYNDYNPPISKECRSVYKKQDGTLVVRVTKHRPIQDSDNWCTPGYINGYGHEMVDYYEQYRFKF